MAQTKFPLGQVYITRGVNDEVATDETFAKFVWDSLKRHARGDWGDLCQEDKKENELSLKEGFGSSQPTSMTVKKSGSSPRQTGLPLRFYSQKSIERRW
jgi:hypothetical protein